MNNVRNNSEVDVREDCSSHWVDKNDVRDTDSLSCVDLNDSDAMSSFGRRDTEHLKPSFEGIRDLT